MKNIIGSCWLLLFPLWVCSQNIAVKEIPTIDQLPVNAIHRVFQDSEGYMWYGTVSGLCRDDGYHVEVFRSDIHTPGLLSDNLIECITEDTQGKIWFGTDKGAYILDKTDYSISPLDEDRLGNKAVMHIHATSDGHVWAGYLGALAKYDLQGKLVKEYPIRNSRGDVVISGFCESRSHEIVITHWDKHIYRLDRERDQFVPFPGQLKNDNACHLIQDREHDYFWVGTWGDGIVRFDPSAAPEAMYIYSPLPVNSMGKQDGVLLCMIQDNRQGRIWALSLRDLLVFEQQADGRVEQIVDYVGVLPANHMMAEVLNGKDCLWVSAFDRSSFIVYLTDDMPKYFALPTLRSQVNNNPAVMALCDDGDGVMWIMQERTGLTLYDLRTDRLAVYSDFPVLRSVPLDSGRELTRATFHGGIWMARDLDRLVYGLSRQGMTMRLEDTIDLSERVASPAYVTKLCEDANGNLWIGTSQGLWVYDIRQRRICAEHPTAGHVTGIIESSPNRVWVATKDKGIYAVQADSLQSLGGEQLKFSCLSMAPDGLLWLGTEDGGVYTYQLANNQWACQDEACGMNGDQVNQIVVDAFNHVWIGTNQKLTEYNPRNGSFRALRTSDSSSLLHRFLPTAMCAAQDGHIYFGGIPGLCRVTPSNSLDRQAAEVNVRITDIRLQGESLVFGPRRTREATHSAELRPDDRNLEICFSSLNHRFASRVRYAYRLKGVDKDWNFTKDGENTAFYNRLSKGIYTFEVKGTDENGLWSDQVTTLTIRRLPAFYETWWAYLIYALAALGLAGYGLHLYLKRMERKNNEMWEDSEEMMRMRTYLDSEVNLPEPEFVQLDKLLLEKAVKAVEDNLTEPDFDVNALASAVNMSRSTLTRKLKAITGRTPLDFIRNIKMKHAKRMLEDKDRTVTEVAATLGYLNRKYFTACFKEEFGMTPSEYQKSLEET